MTSALYQLDPDFLTFPPVEHALPHPNGLLAVGGDLTSERLLSAYQSGIFPWFNPGEPIFWWSPDPRAVLFFDDFHISRSLKKTLKRNKFTFSINKAFLKVIKQCAHCKTRQEGTWITEAMIKSYHQLHLQGYAHSIEVWQDNQLVGGLYGIGVGALFCGESMFHLVTDASKAAMVVLVEIFKQAGGKLIDSQMQNDHLYSLGVTEIPRHDFIQFLNEYKSISINDQCWQSRDYKLQLNE